MSPTTDTVPVWVPAASGENSTVTGNDPTGARAVAGTPIQPNELGNGLPGTVTVTGSEPTLLIVKLRTVASPTLISPKLSEAGLSSKGGIPPRVTNAPALRLCLLSSRSHG
jgi:hypothetical protein